MCGRVLKRRREGGGGEGERGRGQKAEAGTSAHGGEVLAPGQFKALPRGSDVTCGVALASAGRGVDQHQV